MVFNEVVGDLFTVSNDYYLVHCISADFKLGAGIATEFVKRYNMRNKLRNYPNPQNVSVILIDNVFNLVTKKYYYAKPTLKTMQSALELLKKMCLEHNITKLAMPCIGCGLDKLDWQVVRHMLKDIFGPTNIEIRVYLKG